MSTFSLSTCLSVFTLSIVLYAKSDRRCHLQIVAVLAVGVHADKEPDEDLKLPP